MFFSNVEMIPGLVIYFKISDPISRELFLSSFFARGKGSDEIKDLRKSGMESKMSFSFLLDRSRKVFKSS
jgi:hypothetical protein